MEQKNLGYVLIGASVILLVMLSLVKADVDRQGAALCEIVSENPDLDMAECPAHQGRSSWLITISFGLAFLALAIGSYLAFFPEPKSQKPVKKVDSTKLSGEEKEIYDLIKGNEGSMYQGDIVKQTDHSKVKISRVLDKMETKGILERKRRGMTNIVVLK